MAVPNAPRSFSHGFGVILSEFGNFAKYKKANYVVWALQHRRLHSLLLGNINRLGRPPPTMQCPLTSKACRRAGPVAGSRIRGRQPENAPPAPSGWWGKYPHIHRIPRRPGTSTRTRIALGIHRRVNPQTDAATKSCDWPLFFRTAPTTLEPGFLVPMETTCAEAYPR